MYVQTSQQKPRVDTLSEVTPFLRPFYRPDRYRSRAEWSALKCVRSALLHLGYDYNHITLLEQPSLLVSRRLTPPED